MPLEKSPAFLVRLLPFAENLGSFALDGESTARPATAGNPDVP